MHRAPCRVRRPEPHGLIVPSYVLYGVKYIDLVSLAVFAGQSHMTFSVNQDMNGTQTIAESASYPGIRMLTVSTASDRRKKIIPNKVHMT